MKIKQNGVWEFPPDGIQWKQNGIWETGAIEYVLATDDDFSGTVNGSFSYIGTDEYVEIPHVIKGVNVLRYNNMFSGTSVKGVKSTNKNITSIAYMFEDSRATHLDLSNLDTSSVEYMTYVFNGSRSTSIDLSSFDTSNVINMSSMFQNSQITTLDLSSFDTSSVTTMNNMFRNSQATIGYARTQADADNFNSSSNKPAGLIFTVK